MILPNLRSASECECIVCKELQSALECECNIYAYQWNESFAKCTVCIFEPESRNQCLPKHPTKRLRPTEPGTSSRKFYYWLVWSNGYSLSFTKLSSYCGKRHNKYNAFTFDTSQAYALYAGYVGALHILRKTIEGGRGYETSINNT